MTLAKDGQARAGEASGFCVLAVGPRLNLVDEKAFHVEDQLAGEPHPGGGAEFSDNEAVLKQAAFVFDAAPHPLVLVVSVPPSVDGGAVRFPQIQNFGDSGMEDCIKGKGVVPAVGFSVRVSPVEDDRVVSHSVLQRTLSHAAGCRLGLSRRPQKSIHMAIAILIRIMLSCYRKSV
jgi:hypothetical protein